MPREFSYAKALKFRGFYWNSAKAVWQGLLILVASELCTLMSSIQEVYKEFTPIGVALSKLASEIVGSLEVMIPNLGLLLV